MYSQPRFSTRTQKRLQLFVSLIGIIGLVTVWWPASTAKAANLTAARLYLNRQQANVASGVEFDLFVKPATTLTGSTNTITITFPNDSNNNTKWCRTAGSLTLTAEGEPANTTQVTAEGASSMLGTITGACTQTPDKFTISAVGALLNTTEYGVHIAANTAVIGTATAATNDLKVIIATQQGGGADTDTYTIATATVTADQFAVSGTIDPTLSVALSATTLNLSTLTPTNISYQGVTSTVSTNAKYGYVSFVKYSAILTSGSDTIANAGGTITAGTSGFGASTSKSTQTIATASAGVSPACTTSLQTIVGGPFNASTLTTGFQQFASAAAAASSDATTLCFLATVSGTQAQGSYSTTVTLVTTAKF